MPGVTAVMIPVNEPMVTSALPLVQTPPVVVSLRFVVAPLQTIVLPSIGDNGLTVSTDVVLHPVPMVYVIVTVPAAMPVRMPLFEPTPAILVLLLVHVPPEYASSRFDVSPTQSTEGDAIRVGT